MHSRTRPMLSFLLLLIATFTFVSARTNSVLLLKSETDPSLSSGEHQASSDSPVLPPYPPSPRHSAPPSPWWSAPPPEGSSESPPPRSPSPPPPSPPPPSRSPPPPSPPPPSPSPPPPSPPPPSPSPPPPSPPPPSPPPPSPPPPPPRHLPHATLSNLNISHGELSPKFDPKVFNYSASVGSGVKSVRITAEVPESEEEDEYTITANFIPLKSGVPSPHLQVGKAGKDVLFAVTVTALEHEQSTYYLLVHRGKSKWDSFGAKFLLALAIILVVVVVVFLGYGGYVCFKTGRMPAVWPFSRGDSDGYSSLGDGSPAGPSSN